MNVVWIIVSFFTRCVLILSGFGQFYFRFQQFAAYCTEICVLFRNVIIKNEIFSAALNLHLHLNICGAILVTQFQDVDSVKVHFACKCARLFDFMKFVFNETHITFSHRSQCNFQVDDFTMPISFRSAHTQWNALLAITSAYNCTLHLMPISCAFKSTCSPF